MGTPGYRKHRAVSRPLSHRHCWALIFLSRLPGCGHTPMPAAPGAHLQASCSPTAASFQLSMPLQFCLLQIVIKMHRRHGHWLKQIQYGVKRSFLVTQMTGSPEQSFPRPFIISIRTWTGNSPASVPYRFTGSRMSWEKKNHTECGLSGLASLTYPSVPDMCLWCHMSLFLLPNGIPLCGCTTPFICSPAEVLGD